MEYNKKTDEELRKEIEQKVREEYALRKEIEAKVRAEYDGEKWVYSFYAVLAIFFMVLMKAGIIQIIIGTLLSIGAMKSNKTSNLTAGIISLIVGWGKLLFALLVLGTTIS